APAQPYAAAQPMPVAGGIPKGQYLELKPSYLDRFLAYLVDGIVFGFIGAICFIVPFFKDMIPEAGKSVGKSMLKLKVVNYDTGNPITAGQACVRTLCFILPFDLFVPLCTEDGRRIGDMVANTIVLEDR
ncbi:MAG: RDD family protein, partial [Candidatus Heimdallarchaeaceae archaeon]